MVRPEVPSAPDAFKFEIIYLPAKTFSFVNEYFIFPELSKYSQFILDITSKGRLSGIILLKIPYWL